MNKSDLKVGYVVETRNEKRYMLIPVNSEHVSGGLIFEGNSGWLDYKGYTNDLKVTYRGEDQEPYDIVKVYGHSTSTLNALSLDVGKHPLLWERQEELQEQPAISIESLNDFAKEVHQNAVDHGWYDSSRTFGDIVALCHSELSEALEEYRKHMPLVYFVDETADTDGGIETDMSRYKGQKLEGIATEMIDCIIRILDWCGANNIDVENLLRLKHEYNKTRPYKHSGKAL